MHDSYQDLRSGNTSALILEPDPKQIKSLAITETWNAVKLMVSELDMVWGLDNKNYYNTLSISHCMSYF